MNNNYICHYGVKGMKWGVRNDYVPIGREPGWKANKTPTSKKKSGKNIIGNWSARSKSNGGLRNYAKITVKKKVRKWDEEHATAKKGALSEAKSAAVMGLAAGSVLASVSGVRTYMLYRGHGAKTAAAMALASSGRTLVTDMPKVAGSVAGGAAMGGALGAVNKIRRDKQKSE